MLLLVTYDVSTETPEGKKRLRHVAKICENYGQRVQNSVFECLVNPVQKIELCHKLEKTIDYKCDSLRYYQLGKNWTNRVKHVGAKESYNPEEVLIL